MRFHRLVLAQYSRTAADAFSGEGGLHGSGRWHTRGRRAVYAAQSTSLAMAEVLVHLQRSLSIAPFHLWQIDIPEAFLSPLPTLSSHWKEQLEKSRALGDAWLKQGEKVALLLPSALVPGEVNCLLNPEHPAFKLSWVLPGPTLFHFDPRLTKP